MDTEDTVKLNRVKQGDISETPVLKTALPLTSVRSLPTKQSAQAHSQLFRKRDVELTRLFLEQCRQIYLSTFFCEDAPVRSLGFTSAVGGEGKSFLSVATAKILAHDSSHPVTLVDCNWNHPCLHETFRCPLSPGLAEWLRGECSEIAIRHRIDHNLTFIAAGNDKQDTVKLLQQIHQKGLLKLPGNANDLLIVDLPSLITTTYGSLAARLVDSLIVVVRSGVTPEALLAQAYTQIKDLSVQGVILNQVESRIPRWIQQILSI